MKIAIVGASGFVGTALTKEAVERGHEVTAIARHPERIKVERAKPARADVMDPPALAAVLQEHDAVVNAFNPGWTDPNIYDDFVTGFANIEKATEQAGVKRLLIVGGAGSLEVSPGVYLVDTPQFPADFREGARALRDYLLRLRENSTLDWTFLSPAILMNPDVKTGRTGKYRVGADQPVFDDRGESRISAEDLVVALMDELENGKFIRRRFTVAY